MTEVMKMRWVSSSVFFCKGKEIARVVLCIALSHNLDYTTLTSRGLLMGLILCVWSRSRVKYSFWGLPWILRSLD
jgi:hypothetical protein